MQVANHNRHGFDHSQRQESSSTPAAKGHRISVNGDLDPQHLV